MKLAEISVHRPVGVAVGVLLTSLFGLLALTLIPIQLTPDVTRPEVTVQTLWPGASAQEVEGEIILEQEEQLKSVDSLVRMTSESADSLGTIILEFTNGTDLNTALLKVANKLSQVPDYPENVEEPVLTTVRQNRNAIAWFVLEDTTGEEARDLSLLRDFAEDFIKARFERVSGVALSNVYGGREREMRVVADPQSLAARGVSMAELAQALAAENINISAGDLDEGKRRYRVRTLGEFRSPEEIEAVVITRRGGQALYVGDVAHAEFGYKDPEGLVRQFGRVTLAINCLRESGSNVLEVMGSLRQAVDELNRGVLEERGLRLRQVYDETEYIDSAIGLVIQNIWIGGLLAFVVLLVFLRNLGSTLVVSAAIPVSILGTFLAVTLLGRTLNVVSLAGMAFAVGMVVDNSIVVLENIYRHRQLGRTLVEAAIRGTREVWGAVLASTLTTVAVFLPIVFVTEEVGQLFRDIAIAISCAVSLSLFISITLIPSLAPRLLGLRTGRTGHHLSRVGERLARAARRVNQGFAGFFHRVAENLWVRLIVVLGFTGLAIGLSVLLRPDTEYLPGGNRNLVIGILLPPPGYNLEEMTRMAEQVENRLRPLWAPGRVDEPGRAAQEPGIRNFFFVSTPAQAFMGAVSTDDLRVGEIAEAMTRATAGIPGVIAIVQQTSLFEREVASGRSIDIELSGTALESLVAAGGAVMGRTMGALPPGTQAQPIPSLDLNNPELRVVLDRERAAELGLSTRDIGFMVDVLVEGRKVSDYRLGGELIDLVLAGSPDSVARGEDLAAVPVPLSETSSVPLGAFADVELASGPPRISHIERERAITIRVVPATSISLEEAVRRIDEEVLAPLRAAGAIGEDVQTRLAGTADKLAATRDALVGNFLLALLITYLLMCALFESFLYPFVIMFSVPLAAVGGLLGLKLVNAYVAPAPLDVLTMLGFVILIGVVVNNAILIVHQALNNMREGGLPPRQAIADSVHTRVRPIFMSVMTSACGMLPLVLFPGAGSELYRGLGSVVIGGLLVSTVFTLVVVPALFSLVLDARLAVGRGRSRGREPAYTELGPGA